MDREILAVHLALVGGIAVRYCVSSCPPDYTIFVPGYYARWGDGLRTSCPIASRDIEAWRDKAVHPRDIPDPTYDRLVELAIQEGAL